ncbi:MAG: C40 family peptidase [Paludibacteraceae bacterium]|nr:C40 family peptidase [Paludibacteraceae bacterium]
MFGINLNSVLPMRTEPAEQSEMCSQLLFGEHFSILETSDRWLFIHNMSDGYEGWVDRKMVTPISEEIADELSESDPAIVNRPLANGYVDSRGENILLPGGCVLPFYNVNSERFSICETEFRLARESVNMPNEKIFSGEELVSIAFMYLNTPYLWGGRNALGIDCSGFVQTVLRICGRRMPRDAAKQVEQGTVVSFLQEARAGDLAFFENQEGSIVHVGILVNNNEIIHASGRVKLERIDAQGIVNEETGRHSHRLRVIKRVV